MSTEASATPDPAAPAEPQDGQEPEIFDAEYVKKLRAEAAKYRTDAKANAKAAEKLAEIEAANQTEAEKSAAALAAAQSDAEQARADALRFKIAAKFQVGDEDADLFLTGTDEETLTRQAQRLTGIAEERRKNGNHVPREGGNPQAKDDEMKRFTRSLFNKAD